MVEAHVVLSVETVPHVPLGAGVHPVLERLIVFTDSVKEQGLDVWNVPHGVEHWHSFPERAVFSNPDQVRVVFRIAFEPALFPGLIFEGFNEEFTPKSRVVNVREDVFRLVIYGEHPIESGLHSEPQMTGVERCSPVELPRTDGR